jgi:Golgi phosphoprotein 3
MASAGGGLTRRRGGGRVGGEDDDSSRVSSPTPRNGTAFDSRVPETGFTGGENGHKIAFDPRDISESEERSKQPKLTLMEEVLLLGLKDKQVGLSRCGSLGSSFDRRCVCITGLPIFLE